MEAFREVAARCSVAVRPGLAARLLRRDPAAESLEEYVADVGGYQDSSARVLDGEGLLDLIERSGLRGRGGAAFPLAPKARAGRRAARVGPTPVAVADGAVGAPAPVMSR